MTLLRLRPLFALFAVAALGACERHEWEDTKVLFKHGDDHGAHGDGHGDGHGDKADSAHGDDHGAAEKPHADSEKH